MNAVDLYSWAANFGGLISNDRSEVKDNLREVHHFLDGNMFGNKFCMILYVPSGLYWGTKDFEIGLRRLKGGGVRYSAR